MCGSHPHQPMTLAPRCPVSSSGLHSCQQSLPRLGSYKSSFLFQTNCHWIFQSKNKTVLQIRLQSPLVMVACACEPSTQEVEALGSGNYIWLHRKVETSLSCMTHRCRQTDKYKQKQDKTLVCTYIFQKSKIYIGIW